jgi:hypothetical protein
MVERYGLCDCGSPQTGYVTIDHSGTLMMDVQCLRDRYSAAIKLLRIWRNNGVLWQLDSLDSGDITEEWTAAMSTLESLFDA